MQFIRSFPLEYTPLIYLIILTKADEMKIANWQSEGPVHQAREMPMGRGAIHITDLSHECSHARLPSLHLCRLHPSTVQQRANKEVVRSGGVYARKSTCELYAALLRLVRPWSCEREAKRRVT